MKTKLNIKFWWKQIDKVNFALILMLAIIGIILSISLSDSYLFLNQINRLCASWNSLFERIKLNSLLF